MSGINVSGVNASGVNASGVNSSNDISDPALAQASQIPEVVPEEGSSGDFGNLRATIKKSVPPFLRDLPPPPPKKTGFWEWFKRFFGCATKPVGTDDSPIKTKPKISGLECMKPQNMQVHVRECLLRGFQQAPKANFMLGLCKFGEASANRKRALISFIVRTLYPHKSPAAQQEAIDRILGDPQILDDITSVCRIQAMMLATRVESELEVTQTLLRVLFNSCRINDADVDATVYEAAFQALAGALLGHNLSLGRSARLNGILPPADLRMPVATDADLKQLLQNMRRAANNDSAMLSAAMEKVLLDEKPQQPAAPDELHLEWPKPPRRIAKRTAEDSRFETHLAKYDDAIKRAAEHLQEQQRIVAFTRRYQPWLAWQRETYTYLAKRTVNRFQIDKAKARLEHEDRKMYDSFVKEAFKPARDANRFLAKHDNGRKELTAAMLSDFDEATAFYKSLAKNVALPETTKLAIEHFLSRVNLLDVRTAIQQRMDAQSRKFQNKCFMEQARNNIDGNTPPGELAELRGLIHAYGNAINECEAAIRDSESTVNSVTEQWKTLDSLVLKAVALPVDECALAVAWRDNENGGVLQSALKERLEIPYALWNQDEIPPHQEDPSPKQVLQLSNVYPPENVPAGGGEYAGQGDQKVEVVASAANQGVFEIPQH
jgi:hypothetical protein